MLFDMDEEKKKQVEKQARQLLDKFGKSLEKVEKKARKDFGDESYREEGSGERCDDDFRKGIFENAPKTKGGCIVAEKGNW